MLKDKFIITLFLCPVLIYAQNFSPPVNANEESFLLRNETQKENLYKFYRKNIDPGFNLINGREYHPYYLSSTRKPIFLWGEKYSSAIVIKGVRYNDILLEYDSYMDEVLYFDSSRSFRNLPLRIAINKDIVDLFEFIQDNDTLRFKFFRNSNNFNLNDGFYEDVYDNKSIFLIKHYSNCTLNNGINDYPYHTISYINVGNGFVRFKSVRQLCRLMGYYSSDVRKYCRKQGFPAGSKDKKQIETVLLYYDDLKSQAE